MALKISQNTFFKGLCKILGKADWLMTLVPSSEYPGFSFRLMYHSLNAEEGSNQEMPMDIDQKRSPNKTLLSLAKRPENKQPSRTESLGKTNSTTAKHHLKKNCGPTPSTPAKAELQT